MNKSYYALVRLAAGEITGWMIEEDLELMANRCEFHADESLHEVGKRLKGMTITTKTLVGPSMWVLPFTRFPERDGFAEG